LKKKNENKKPDINEITNEFNLELQGEETLKSIEEGIDKITEKMVSAKDFAIDKSKEVINSEAVKQGIDYISSVSNQSFDYITSLSKQSWSYLASWWDKTGKLIFIGLNNSGKTTLIHMLSKKKKNFLMN